MTHATANFNVINHRHHGKPWEVRFQQAKTACEHENRVHGQCNAFSMVQYWAPITIPYPLKTVFHKNDENFKEHPGKFDTYIRSCPHTLAWFQVVKDKFEVKLNGKKEFFKFKYALKYG